MPNAFRAYPPLVITSSGSTVTNAVNGFDDAIAVRIFISSSVSGTFFNVQVCPRYSSGQFPQAYQVSLTTQFASLQSVQTSAGTVVAVLPGQTVAIPLDGGAAFQQLRLLGTGAETSGVTVGWVTAAIHV